VPGQFLRVVGDDHGDDQGHGRVQPVPAAGAEDDGAGGGHASSGRRVGDGVQQDGPDIQVRRIVVAAEDQGGGQHDGRGDAADDQYRQALDPAGSRSQTLDRRDSDRDVQDQQPAHVDQGGDVGGVRMAARAGRAGRPAREPDGQQ